MIVAEYLHQLVALATSAKAHFSLARRPLWQNVVFFLVTFLFLGFARGLYTQATALPALHSAINASIDEAERHYPEQLEITWDTQALRLNQAPLTVPYPQTIVPTDWQLPTTLAYYTDQPITSPESVVQNTSFLLLDPTTLYINNRGRWSSLPLTELPGFEHEFTINASNRTEMSATVKQLTAATITALKPMVVITYTLFAGPVHLWMGLVDGLIVYLLLKLYRANSSFPQVFALCLFSLLLAEAITLLGTMLYQELTVPLQTISFWIVLSYVLIVNHRQMFHR